MGQVGVPGGVRGVWLVLIGCGLEAGASLPFSANLLRSDLKVPPYLGLLPIRSIISGMQESNTA